MTAQRHTDFDQLARVSDKALSCSATIRASDHDFQVEEQLPFEPDGTGGHTWLLIRKQGINTAWLAAQLAKHAGVPEMDVGYAGLKDRHAVTTQWFSIKVEGVTEPDWAVLESETIQILTVTRHSKKLRRGVLSGNRFRLRLTERQGVDEDWQVQLRQIASQGVPNYFAEQRFGHQGQNLQRVSDWFAGGKVPKKRQQKSLYLSSARSWLFNWVLSQRVENDTWHQAMVGDRLLLAGTKSSTFVADEVDMTIQQRLGNRDVHPTGPLWGKGEPLVQADSLVFETAALQLWQDWQQGLEKAGLTQDRRSLRLFPEQFEWTINPDVVELTFFLPAGSYATAVLRELAIIDDKASQRIER